VEDALVAAARKVRGVVALLGHDDVATRDRVTRLALVGARRRGGSQHHADGYDEREMPRSHVLPPSFPCRGSCATAYRGAG
jgi:hypothetical protein